MQQLRYCLCTVSRAVSIALAGKPTQTFPTSLRRTLFDVFSTWCEEGSTPPERYRTEVSRMLALSRMRIKDPEAARHSEIDTAETADVVEHAAYLGMAAMLLVGVPCKGWANSQACSSAAASVDCLVFGACFGRGTCIVGIFAVERIT